MTFKSVLWCVFGHDRVLARNQRQELVYRCCDCQDEVRVLASEMISQGPKAKPDQVLGQPKTRTFQEAKLSRLQPKRRA